jgi:DNA-binding NtrC family response regulator
MPNPTVVLLGSLPIEASMLAGLASEFGWSVDAAMDFSELRELRQNRNVVAILFDARNLSLSIPQALESVRAIAPQAQLIPCYRFSEVVNWPDLAEAGAFHALALPFDTGEIRQSLGFVWSARLRKTANVVPMRPASERPRELAAKAGQLRDAS